MTQRRVSKVLIVSTVWVFITAFLMIKAYDQGYKHGARNTLELVIEMCK